VTKTPDTYYVAGDTSHKRTLDVYYKRNPTLNKVVLFVPGGAWRQGDKDQYDSMALTLASLYNYTMVVTNYRLSNENDGSAVHPDHIEDVALAFSWVMKNITNYGGDPGSVFIFGQSAGGHLVSLLAADEQYLKQVGYSFKNIRGVISMSGAYALSDLVAYPLNPLGLNAEDVLMYKSIVLNAFGSYDTVTINPASPSCHVHDSLPPFLLIYTELDMPGFALDGEHFYALINNVGGLSVSINKLYPSDYSTETWQTATILAAAEPALAEYIGHYAEVVAINKYDHLKVPTKWIVNFIRDY
jgi:acetyl esterase/lipase